MQALQLFRLGCGDRAPGLPQQSICQQPRAHPDPPMNKPGRKLDAGALQGGAPRKYVLINAVDQGAIKVKEECRLSTSYRHRRIFLLCH